MNRRAPPSRLWGTTMTAVETASQTPEPSWRAASEAEVIMIFASNTEVLNVEDFLEEKDLTFELVPVPKEVNPNCGLAISFKSQAEAGILTALAEGGFKPQASYLRRGDDFQPWEKERQSAAS